MAVNFKTSSLILSRQLVTATGNNLYVNGLLVGSGVYSTVNALTETGIILFNRDATISGGLQSQIQSTGQQAWTHGQNNALNLSGQLALTGANLYATLTGMSGQAVTDYATKGQLNSLSGFTVGISGYLQAQITEGNADVSSINGQSGTLLLVGTGGLTVISGGPQLILISGDQSISGALTATGVTLGTKIDSLSGFVDNVSGGLETRIAQTGAASVIHANGIGTIISGNLTLTGQTLFNRDIAISGGLEVRITATGNSAVAHSNGVGINLSGNLTTTGQILQGMIIGGDTNLSGNLTITGQTLRNLTIGGDTNLSGNLTITGQTLYNLIVGASGHAGANYAPALANYVYQSGAQLVTGIKTFLSELRFNGGVKTPERFIGASNYSLVSGDFVVVATGAIPNVTGILPTVSDGSYSGVLFTILNARTISLPVSGIVGGTINPIISPNDALQVYGGSGVWHYIGQTGSPIWADQNNNAINLSGNLTLTGQTLQARITSLSGFVGNVSGGLETRIAQTGSAAVVHSNGIGTIISGNLTLTGQTLLGFILGGDTNLSGNLTSTGQTLQGRINSLSGFVGSVSGGLEVRITATGSSAVAHANGIGNALSGNLTLTGVTLVNQIAGLSGIVNVLYGTNIVYTTGNQNIGNIKTFNSGIFTGAIGILSANPSYPLTIGSVTSAYLGLGNGSNTSPQIVLNSNGPGNFRSLDFSAGASSTPLWSIGYRGSAGIDTGDFAFYDNNFDAPVFVIKDRLGSGYFGFGTVNPQMFLHATGSIRTDAGYFSGVTNLADIFATKTEIINTGSKITALSGFVNLVSGGLEVRITATGNAAIAHANGIGVNLSGNLTLTGQTLQGRIDSLSGFIGGVSGALQTQINSLTTATQLYQTGSNLYNMITGLSGQAVIDYATKTQLTTTGQTLIGMIIGGDTNLSGNLTLTGQTLQGRINALSGFVGNVSGGLETRIAQTGSAAVVHANGIGANLSGNLTQTGVTLGAKIDSLSGFVGQVSGGLEIRIVATGNSAIAHANGIGVNLSGNLTLTGQTLQGRITSLSGFVGNVSGGLEVRIAQTGQAAWISANGAATNISGNLTTTGQTLLGFIIGGDTNLSGNLALTGQTLQGRINSLSGYVNGASGALSAVRVSGSSTIPIINLTGLGGIQVIHSGDSVFISGGAAAVDTTTQYSSFTTPLVNGTNSVFIRFPEAFANPPVIVTSLTITGYFAPSMAIKTPTISGYTAFFSAPISENGAFLNTFARGTGVTSVTEQYFSSGIPVGVNQFLINFPTTFSSIPNIVASLSTTGDFTPLFATRNITTTGYVISFSAPISQSGVSVYTFARI